VIKPLHHRTAIETFFKTSYMKNLMNSVRLIGNVGKEPQLKDFGNGKKVATLTLATSEKRKDANGKLIEHTDWHNLVFWGKQADVVVNYVGKGVKIAVEGKLSHRDYTTASGEKRYVTEVVVNEMAFLNGRKPTATAEEGEPLPF
jgi:single-strand DNA-binding protein